MKGDNTNVEWSDDDDDSSFDDEFSDVEGAMTTTAFPRPIRQGERQRYHQGRSDDNRRTTAVMRVQKITPMEIFAGGVAIASIATSAVAMIMVPFNMVYAAGGLSCVIGPYAYYQQRLLTDVRALQQTQKELSDQIDQLKYQNSRLHTTLEELTTTVNRLEDVEQAYNVITQTQSQSIEAFEEQVKDNKLVLGKMQSGLKSNILQNILKVITRSDTDGSLTLDATEINDLIARFKNVREANVLVEFNEERFRYYIAAHRESIKSVMEIIRNLIHDENDGDGHGVGEEEAIFIIRKK